MKKLTCQRCDKPFTCTCAASCVYQGCSMRAKSKKCFCPSCWISMKFKQRYPDELIEEDIVGFKVCYEITDYKAYLVLEEL